MMPQEDPKHQLAEELESLRRQICEFQSMVANSLQIKQFAASQTPTGADKTPVSGAGVALPEILDEGPFGIALLDFDFHFLKVNTTLCRLLGYSSESLLSRTLPDITHPEDVDNCAHLVEKVRSGSIPHDHIEKRFLTADKQMIWVQLTVSLIRDENQNPACGLAIVENISERKRTEEQLQQANRKLASWVDELERRTQEMTWLGEMGDMLRSCLTAEEIYGVIIRVAQRLFPVQAGALYIVGSTGSTAESVAAWGDTSLIERAFSPEECWALRRSRVHFVEDTDTGVSCKHLHYPPPSGYLCIPLIAQTDAIGVLYLTYTNNEHPSEAKQGLALAMAEQIALALSNLRLHEAIRTQSIRDPLTGLFNRSFMEESFDLELHRAARYHRPLGILMLDLDDFDTLLQTHGREVADSLLRDLGGMLHSQVRKEDLACRSGNNQFTVILPLGSLETTRQRAEFLREMIQKLEIKDHGRKIARITASIGVAAYPEHGRTTDDLMRAVDEALKQVHETGGNRVRSIEQHR
jgi:diguanylate cyclase (GGDEF)-like protein/PAS domain S-box-containing protein